MSIFKGNQTIASSNSNEVLEALNDKMDNDMSNLPSTVDFVVETQLPDASNNYQWFRKYRSGWVEQGGYVVIPGDVGATVTFPVPMHDTCYSVYAGAVQGRTTTGGSRCFIADRTETSMTVDWTAAEHIDGTWWEIKGRGA